jgi:hypothetical protein
VQLTPHVEGLAQVAWPLPEGGAGHAFVHDPQ